MDTPSGWQAVAHAEQPPRRSARPARGPRRRRRPARGLPRPAPRSEHPRRAGGVRHLGAPRLVAVHHVQRRPHRGHQPGHRRVPGRRRAPTGPLFIGRDTHALSEPAWVTACEVFLANDVHVLVDAADGYTPTPAVSTAIIGANRGRTDGLADGVVITPSHNPPRDGGFKYNPPHGGPADTDATSWIADRANELLVRQARRGASGARSTAARWAGSTSSASTSTTCPTWSTSTRSGRRACGSARTRSAGRASPTGARSPSATRST